MKQKRTARQKAYQKQLRRARMRRFAKQLLAALVLLAGILYVYDPAILTQGFSAAKNAITSSDAVTSETVDTETTNKKAAAETPALYAPDGSLLPFGPALSTEFAPDMVPPYAGKGYIVLNDNVPWFQESDLVTQSYEYFSPLDALGRCGPAVTCAGEDLMPETEREEIRHIRPSGWRYARYPFIDQEMLYNRTHLLAFMLTGENDTKENLITGTRHMNTISMLPFEMEVANYIRNSGEHVLYRVTPLFRGDNLVADGILMEAQSVEDGGRHVQFNVFCYNVQPGIHINYKDGRNWQIEAK